LSTFNFTGLSPEFSEAFRKERQGGLDKFGFFRRSGVKFFTKKKTVYAFIYGILFKTLSANRQGGI